jgi:hypothetical protein
MRIKQMKITRVVHRKENILGTAYWEENELSAMVIWDDSPEYQDFQWANRLIEV